MNIIFQNQTSENINEASLLKKTEVALTELENLGVETLGSYEELVIVFVGKDEGERLNNEFRDKEGPTDVLSFEPMEPLSLGELALCYPVLESQAQENGHSIVDESMYLIIHGVLHLLGYDHEENEVDAKEMFALQDEVFEKVRS